MTNIPLPMVETPNSGNTILHKIQKYEAQHGKHVESRRAYKHLHGGGKFSDFVSKFFKKKPIDPSKLTYKSTFASSSASKPSVNTSQASVSPSALSPSSPLRSASPSSSAPSALSSSSSSSFKPTASSSLRSASTSVNTSQASASSSTSSSLRSVSPSVNTSQASSSSLNWNIQENDNGNQTWTIRNSGRMGDEVNQCMFISLQNGIQITHGIHLTKDEIKGIMGVTTKNTELTISQDHNEAMDRICKVYNLCIKVYHPNLQDLNVFPTQPILDSSKSVALLCIQHFGRFKHYELIVMSDKLRYNILAYQYTNPLKFQQMYLTQNTEMALLQHISRKPITEQRIQRQIRNVSNFKMGIRMILTLNIDAAEFFFNKAISPPTHDELEKYKHVVNRMKYYYSEESPEWKYLLSHLGRSVGSHGPSSTQVHSLLH